MLFLEQNRKSAHLGAQALAGLALGHARLESKQEPPPLVWS